MEVKFLDLYKINERFRTEIDLKIKELSNRVEQELHKLIKKEINQECGIGGTENIIIGIQAQINQPRLLTLFRFHNILIRFVYWFQF